MPVLPVVHFLSEWLLHCRMLSGLFLGVPMQHLDVDLHAAAVAAAAADPEAAELEHPAADAAAVPSNRGAHQPLQHPVSEPAQRQLLLLAVQWFVDPGQHLQHVPPKQQRYYYPFGLTRWIAVE